MRALQHGVPFPFPVSPPAAVARGRSYTHVGLVDNGRSDGFSALAGHFVYNEVLTNAPHLVPHFVWLVNVLKDNVLDGELPDLESHPHYKTNPRADSAKRGRIDFLTCAECGTQGLEELRGDVKVFATGMAGCYAEYVLHVCATSCWCLRAHPPRAATSNPL